MRRVKNSTVKPQCLTFLGSATLKDEPRVWEVTLTNVSQLKSSSELLWLQMNWSLPHTSWILTWEGSSVFFPVTSHFAFRLQGSLVTDEEELNLLFFEQTTLIKMCPTGIVICHK